MINNNIIIEDTTLRDGEQAPGVAFNKSMKVKIHDLLIDAGVKWLEIGTPAMGGEELDSIKELLSRNSDATLVGWNRGIKKDIEYSLSLGFTAVHIGLPVSSIQLKDSINKDRNWLLQTAVDLIKYAKDKGAYVSISAEDIGRTEGHFLQEYAVAVTEAGADRLRLSDTVGILDFYRYASIVKNVKSVTDIDLQCHAHNDLGLSVANTVACLNEGVKFFHSTINGIGERAGMPDTMQVIMILLKLYKIDIGVDPKKIVKASEYVREITRTDGYPWTPITGRNVFSHESGIHVKGMINNADTFESINPAELGRSRKYILGKHSGKTAIEYFLANNGIKATEDELAKCLKLVRKRAIENLGEVSIDELIEIYNQ